MYDVHCFIKNFFFLPLWEPTRFSFKDSVELTPDAVDDGLVRHCDTISLRRRKPEVSYNIQKSQ